MVRSVRTVLIAATEADPSRPGSGFVPPCSVDDAARIAQASLDRTVAVARQSDPERLLVVLDPDSALGADGVEVVAPAADEEDERIAAALAT